MRYRTGIVSMIALTLFLCCGAAAPISCAPAPEPSHTGAHVAEALIVTGVAVGTIVLVDRHLKHHNIEGCVYASAQNGLEVRNEADKKAYRLIGVTQDIKPGDRIRVHGVREKKRKDSSDDATFFVQKVSRHDGSCHAPTSKS